MSKLIQLTKDLSLPLDIITMRTAEYGDSGAGKTAFARLMAEKVHEANHRFCAIDLKNDWWGLKSSADGATAGIPVVIFGGPRADVKLFDGGGAALADTVASIDQSVIIDLDSMSRARQEKLLTAFLDRLYDANRRPLMLFCDEADRYAPQKPMTQDAIMSLSSSEDIARRGRKRGIGSMWLTQRTAVLNKNVSEFCNLVIVFRTPGSRDLKELEERVGRIADKATVAEVLRLAPGLEDGQAFFLSSHPKLRKFLPSPVRPIQLPLPWTFDSSATPGVGQRRREPKVLAKADLVVIESKMAEQVERAKDSDPGEQRKRLNTLTLELNALKSKPAPAAKVETKTVAKPVLKEGQLARMEKLAERMGGLASSCDAILTTAGEKLVELSAMRGEIAQTVLQIGTALHPPTQPAVAPGVARVAPAAPALPAVPRVIPPRTPRQPAGDGTIDGPMKKILDSYAWWHSIGIAKPSRENIAPIAGYSNIRSSGFRNPLYACQAAGLVSDDALTEQGNALATWPDEVTTLKAYHEKLTKVMDGPTKKLFDELVKIDGPTTRDELAAACEYTNPRSSGFRNPLYRLSSMGIVLLKKEDVTPTDLMFPAGLK